MNEIIEWDLLKFVKILWQKVWAIILAAAILAAAMCVYAANFSVPVYRASVSLYVNNTINAGDMSGITSADLMASQDLVKTCIYILRSNRVLKNAADKIKWDISAGEIGSMVSASGVGKTECFVLSVSHPNPQVAADVANALGAAATEEIPKVILGSSLSIIDDARVPGTPYSPNIMKRTLLGAVIGAVLASVIIIVLELFDKRIKDEEDLAKISNLTVLGVIPDFVDANENRYEGYYGKHKETVE